MTEVSGGGGRFARTHRDLEVYGKAFGAAMRLFELSRHFPEAERFGITDQVRRSSRSVCANIAEAWRKRLYPKAFASKLSDAEGEAAETQVWIEFAVECGYINRDDAADLYRTYNEILKTLVGMRRHAKSWSLEPQPPE